MNDSYEDMDYGDGMEVEIDPIDEADRRARIECEGIQYFTVRRDIKVRYSSIERI